MEKNATAGRAQVHTFIDCAVREELRSVADANDRSLAAEIRRAIDAHVQRELAEEQRSS
jgi:hypothetical protein